ncbi:uncharacterized protein LOC123309590 [Coccinella septempunctata]|uniref:uncharacterized protein LOC123309590 n=1 Tax=Coccinella septempunctata TaxID=41139 RepID=UPI001D08E961|nr:uncharacterized protein LOC123309590 [Coccinella septempunctata]
MAVYKGIILLLWLCLLVQSGSTAKNRLSKRNSAQDRIQLQKSQPYIKEEPGFLSRIASWIFPFGGGTSNNELDSVPSAGHHSASYLPPPNRNPPKYLPPGDLSPPHYTQSYPTTLESSDCNPCNREPWVPIPGKSGRNNNVINFVPQHEVHNVILDGLNPPPVYGPPNPPNSPVNTQSNQNFLDVTFDRPPSTHQDLPNVEYGPPNNNLPSPQYGVPNIEITPSVLVGSLDIPQDIRHSFNQYVPVANGKNIPETPSAFPQLPNSYGPPTFQFRGKATPVPLSVPSSSSPTKGHVFPPPIKTSTHTNYINILGMRPPPPPSFTTHLVPVNHHHKNPNSIQDILQPPVSQHSVLDEEFPPYTSKPIDAYSTPDIHGIEQIPLSSGDNDDFGYPIAFPNLSIRPLVPLHNYIKFRQGLGSSEKVESIQILQSVPIADYVSSIEHPINVIQSPIVDLSIRNEPETTKLINISDQNKQSINIPDRAYSKPNTIQSGIFVNPNVNPEKLNENPIVVDDAQIAASSHNETYEKIDQSSKRDNNGDITIHSFDSSTIPITGREDIDDINSVEREIVNNLRNGFDKKNASKELKFTEPPMDYSQWTPTWGGISMEMTPPSVQSAWTTSFDSTEAPMKKTKHIQIIIPYYNFNTTSKNLIKNGMYNKNILSGQANSKKEVYTTLVPVYTPPPSTEQSLWSHFLTNIDGLPTSSVPASGFQKPSSTRAYNIQDIIGENAQTKIQDLPFDILTFQKNIDEWTHQAFAKTTEKLSSGKGVVQKLNPSKRIPDQYLTTVPYDYTTIQPLSNFLSDQEPAGSVRKENFQDDVGNSLSLDDVTTPIEEGTTVASTTEINTERDMKTTVSNTKEKKSLWDETKVTLSSDTKEKVYIVTPATTVAWSSPPKVLEHSTTTENTLLFDHPKFSIRIEEDNSDTSKNANSTTKVIFSEWPHKINNLQTTTDKPTSRHPLFGLMDKSAYNPPQNRVIANVNGHSRILQDLASFVEEQSKNNQ